MDEQPGTRKIEWGPLIGGIVVGWLLSWFLFAFAALLLYTNLGGTRETLQSAIALTSLLLAPVVLGVLALRRRRQGQVVAGVLMGLTVGAIAGAGVCTASLVPGMF
jgi:hypothetical protein